MTDAHGPTSAAMHTRYSTEYQRAVKAAVNGDCHRAP